MSQASSRALTSSPLSSLQSSQATLKTASSQSRPHYRQAAPLPSELQRHLEIYLEENLFSQAFDLLLSLISASANNLQKKVPMVAPEYVGILSTLAVHPSFTTRTASQDKLDQANTALRLLGIIAKTVGPVNARLTEALRFRRYADARSSRRTVEVGDDDDWKAKVNIRYADQESVYKLAADFWSVVGWALNCSCLQGVHAERWEYWCPWLDYMINTLENDWDIREEAGTCDQSLLRQYIVQAEGGNAKGRRILRAVFADGGLESTKEFPELFRKELKPVKQDRDKAKKQEVAVDVDENIYGDWLQDSESTTDEENDQAMLGDDNIGRAAKRQRTRSPSTRRRNKLRATKTVLTDYEDSDSSANVEAVREQALWSPESVRVRLKLLQLLTTFSIYQNTNKTLEAEFSDPHDLFTLFVEFVRPLPLPIFQQIILPTGSAVALRPETRVALCEFILQRIVSSNKSSNRSTLDPMTQDRLQSDYLPFASDRPTVDFQAKVSLLNETILRQLIQADGKSLSRTEDFVIAVEMGISVRAQRAKEIRDGTRHKKATTTKDDDYALHVLEDSSMRTKFLLHNLID